MELLKNKILKFNYCEKSENANEKAAYLFWLLYQFDTIEHNGLHHEIKDGIFMGYGSSKCILALIMTSIIKEIQQETGKEILYHGDDMLISINNPDEID